MPATCECSVSTYSPARASTCSSVISCAEGRDGSAAAAASHSAALSQTIFTLAAWRLSDFFIGSHLELAKPPVRGSTLDQLVACAIPLAHFNGHQKAEERLRLIAHDDGGGDLAIAHHELAHAYDAGVGFDPEASRGGEVAPAIGPDDGRLLGFPELDGPHFGGGPEDRPVGVCHGRRVGERRDVCLHVLELEP